MTLTKADIIQKIQESNGYNHTTATELVEICLELMKTTMEKGEDIMISGFGKFCICEKSTRRGRNPATGESMELKSRRVVTFRTSGNLRKRLNGE